MYLTEWILWLGNIKSDAWINEQNDTPYVPTPIYADPANAEQDRVRRARFSLAKCRGPVYACNNTILEMRCGGMEEKRGFITFISALFFLPLAAAGDTTYILLTDFGIDRLDWRDFISMVFQFSIGLGFLYGYFKYLFRFTRLESFTSRHLLIRFNRITRQVYLHRPPSCGGIAVLPWDDIHHDEVPGVNLIVGWYPPYSPLPFPNMVFVGKKSVSEAEMKAEWEYIRRYMDEGGLDAVDPPRISSHLLYPGRPSPRSSRR